MSYLRRIHTISETNPESGIQKSSAAGASESVCMWERVKEYIGSIKEQ